MKNYLLRIISRRDLFENDGVRVTGWGKVTNLNMFNSSLSLERMVGLTTAGEEECESPGDLVSWEEAEWTLHSQAKMIEVDKEWEGPCRRESKVQVFTAAFDWHHQCMRLCQKIYQGRSPPVTTAKEWENLKLEIDLITQDRLTLHEGAMWLSATEGDKDKELARLDHWPETEFVNDEVKRLEAVETVWRDFFSGERLNNWTKPWQGETKDTTHGDQYNCMYVDLRVPWGWSWVEYHCKSFDMSCPCSYPIQPLLRLRGLCKSSLIERSPAKLFTPKQLPGNIHSKSGPGDPNWAAKKFELSAIFSKNATKWPKNCQK